MASKLNVIDLRKPEYNYHQQENDFSKTDSEKRHPSNKAIRVVQAALPFVALCKPLGRPFALVMGGSRAITCLSKTYTDILERKGRGEIAPDLLQSTIAVIALGGTLFAHPLGMLVTTCHDIGINIIALHQAWLENDSDKAKEVGLQLLNNCFYIGLFFTGYTELLVASLAMQILSGAFHSYQEYSQRNYIEAVSGALMVIIRMNQAAAPVSELHQKWKAAIQSRKEAIINCNTAKSDIGVSSSTSPEVVDILIKYSNNPLKITPLSYAIEKGDLHAAEILINAGLGLNAKEVNGVTPAIRLLNLIRSSNGQNKLATDLFYKILAKGIDFQLPLYPENNLRVNQGQQLLIIALWIPNSVDILELLLSRYKIDPNFEVNNIRFVHFLIGSEYVILYPDKLQVLLKNLAKVNDLDCFSAFWIFFVPKTDIQKYAANFKVSVALLINHGANPRRPSTKNPQIAAIDQMLKNVMSLPESQEANVFKKDVIPFLLGLGAQII